MEMPISRHNSVLGQLIEVLDKTTSPADLVISAGLYETLKDPSRIIRELLQIDFSVVNFENKFDIIDSFDSYKNQDCFEAKVLYGLQFLGTYVPSFRKSTKSYIQFARG